MEIVRWVLLALQFACAVNSLGPLPKLFATCVNVERISYAHQILLIVYYTYLSHIFVIGGLLDKEWQDFGLLLPEHLSMALSVEEF